MTWLSLALNGRLIGLLQRKAIEWTQSVISRLSNWALQHLWELLFQIANDRAIKEKNTLQRKQVLVSLIDSNTKWIIVTRDSRLQMRLSHLIYELYSSAEWNFNWFFDTGICLIKNILYKTFVSSFYYYLYSACIPVQEIKRFFHLFLFAHAMKQIICFLLIYLKISNSILYTSGSLNIPHAYHVLVFLAYHIILIFDPLPFLFCYSYLYSYQV